MKKICFSLVLAITVFSLAGCVTPEDIMGAAVRGVTDATTEQVEQATYRTFAPAEPAPAPTSANWSNHMAVRARVAFNHAFTVGGMWPGLVDYSPGEWTRYEIKRSGESQSVTVERALLRSKKNGKKWWRISWTTRGKTWTYEFLIHSRRNKLLRLRGKDPKGNVKEIPVREGTVYQAPREMTEESIRGAISGRANLGTPAGEFSAKRLEYGAPGQGGRVSWWLNDSVPGGVVKYQAENQSEAVVWTSTLTDYGQGATTELDSF